MTQTATLDQLTHELSTIEQALARIHRELTRIRPTPMRQSHPSSQTPLTDRITAMDLPVADWETMEREIYGE